MDEEVKREIILAHYQNPLHRHLPEGDNYIKVNTANQSCIDNINLYLSVEDNIIKDITFDGEACAISISSTSIMIENLIGKTLDEAKEFIDNFDDMINERKYDESILKDATVYDNIYKQSSRKTCAFLPYRGIKDAIDKYSNK